MPSGSTLTWGFRKSRKSRDEVGHVQVWQHQEPAPAPRTMATPTTDMAVLQAVHQQASTVPPMMQQVSRGRTSVKRNTQPQPPPQIPTPFNGDPGSASWDGRLDMGESFDASNASFRERLADQRQPVTQYQPYAMVELDGTSSPASETLENPGTTESLAAALPRPPPTEFVPYQPQYGSETQSGNGPIPQAMDPVSPLTPTGTRPEFPPQPDSMQESCGNENVQIKHATATVDGMTVVLTPQGEPSSSSPSSPPLSGQPQAPVLQHPASLTPGFKQVNQTTESAGNPEIVARTLVLGPNPGPAVPDRRSIQPHVDQTMVMRSDTGQAYWPNPADTSQNSQGAGGYYAPGAEQVSAPGPEDGLRSVGSTWTGTRLDDASERQVDTVEMGDGQVDEVGSQAASTQISLQQPEKRRLLSKLPFGKGGGPPIGRGLTSEDVQKRAQEVLKPFGVKRRDGLDWFSTALMWLPDRLHLAEKDLVEKNEELKKVKGRLRTAHGTIDSLREELGRESEGHKHLRSQAERVNADLDKAGRKLDRYKASIDQLEASAQQLDASIRQLQAQNAALHQDKTNLEGQMREAAARHTSERQQFEADMRARMAEERDKLRRDIAARDQRIAAWSRETLAAVPDQAFAERFQDVARQVGNLASWVARPEPLVFDRAALDPTDYLGRSAQLGGSRGWPKFVRNVCWRVILGGFFQPALGFGAFGSSGSGFDRLDDVYQLFTRPDPSDPSGATMILPNDKDTGTRRASFFNTVLQGVARRPETSSAQASKSYSAMFEANVHAVAASLIAALEVVGNSQLDGHRASQIGSLARELGLLALEMGSQRAQVRLEGCVHGEWVVSGGGGSGGDEDQAAAARFRDENGTLRAAARVDIMTQPCLVRVGDGREDFGSVKVIVIGEFVALK